MSATAQLSTTYSPFIVLKVSSHCNLACDYCHSTGLPKKKLLMPIELISRTIKGFVPYFAAQGDSRLELVFHGGEPLLAGLEFYRKVLELESHLDTADLSIINEIQTNGTLITEDWIELFKQGQFRIGISADGPAALHDKYRKDRNGKPTFERIAHSIELLQEENLSFGLLSVITKESPDYYEDFFNLLIEWPFSSVNFLPCIGPAAREHIHAYSKFTRDFFDLWLRNDAPFEVLTFLDIMRQIEGQQGRLCYLSEKCRKFPTIDTLGRIYPCDRYIGDERYRIGTVSASSFKLVESPQMKLHKLLPKPCAACEVNNICSGGCPALIDPRTGKDLYCSARKALIQHIIQKFDEHDLSSTDILRKFDKRTMKWADSIEWGDTIDF
ncbi:MAG: radical SAM protein [Candidatus Hodarchaeota archaeon]